MWGKIRKAAYKWQRRWLVHVWAVVEFLWNFHHPLQCKEVQKSITFLFMCSHCGLRLWLTIHDITGTEIKITDCVRPLTRAVIFVLMETLSGPMRDQWKKPVLISSLKGRCSLTPPDESCLEVLNVTQFIILKKNGRWSLDHRNDALAFNVFLYRPSRVSESSFRLWEGELMVLW